MARSRRLLHSLLILSDRYSMKLLKWCRDRLTTSHPSQGIVRLRIKEKMVVHIVATHFQPSKVKSETRRSISMYLRKWLSYSTRVLIYLPLKTSSTFVNNTCCRRRRAQSNNKGGSKLCLKRGKTTCLGIVMEAARVRQRQRACWRNQIISIKAS